MKKVILILSLISLNIEPMQRLGSLAARAKISGANLAQFAKSSLKDGARQFTTQATPTNGVKWSLGKKIGITALAATGLAACAIEICLKESPATAIRVCSPLFYLVKDRLLNVCMEYGNHHVGQYREYVNLFNLTQLCKLSKDYAIYFAMQIKGIETSMQAMQAIAESCPEACEILKNSLLLHCDSYWLLKTCEASKEHTDILVQAAIDTKISDLHKISILASTNPESFDLLKSKILRNINSVDFQYISKICNFSQEHSVILARAAMAANIHSMHKITIIACTSPESFDILKKKILQNIDQVYNSDILQICNNSNKHAILLAQFAIDNKMENLKILCTIANACDESSKILSTYLNNVITKKIQMFIQSDNSQSRAYLRHIFTPDTIRLGMKFLKYSNSKFIPILQHEAELNKSGFSCFYHAQMSQFGFLEDLTKDLVSALHKLGVISEEMPDDFIAIQNRPGLLVDTMRKTRSIKSMSAKEHEIMMQDRDEEEQYRLPHRLSVNAFLAGNLTDTGSCTLSYLKYNINVNHKLKLSLKTELFEKLGIPKNAYEKYLQKLSDLEEQYKDLFKDTGRLLQICIPKDKVDEMVYLAKPGAYRISHKTLDGEYVTTVSRFLEIATTNPERFAPEVLDQASECAIPLTFAGALDPKSGVKVFAYDSEPKDQERYKKFIAERDQIIKDIAQETAMHKSMRGKKYHLCCQSALDKFAAEAAGSAKA